MSTTATTTAPQPPAKSRASKATLRDHLESPAFMSQIAKVLPKHLTPTRMVRVALTAMTKTPKLAECDQASFFSALLTLSQIGLEPDGRLAHLIPFANNKKGITECQLIVDWKGLAQLAYRSGLVSALHADVIYSGDLFEYSCGDLATHTPHFLRTDAAKPESAGSLIGVYALAKMKDGSRAVTVLSIAEVDGIRKRSKSSGSGPWVSDYLEMAKKTAFRRLSKWLPLSSENYTAALDVDDEDAITKVEPLEPASIERYIPAAKEPEVVNTDPWNRLSMILESKGFTVKEFVECMVGDGKLFGADPSTILTIDDIPKSAAVHYVGADFSGSEAIRSINFVTENKAQ